MKVVVKVSKRDDFGDSHVVEIDGASSFRIHPLCECPEDAVIGRDLIDGHDIAAAIRLGYEAGKRGETLDISEEEQE